MTFASYQTTSLTPPLLTLLRERKARNEARRSLIEWCRLCGFEPASHHELIIRELEAVVRGDVQRLALFLPPGSAKSTYASILFPPWFLSHKPNASIIAASHTQELAEKWGRRVRNLVAQNAELLGVGVSGDSSAAGRWETSGGGEYYAAGVGGSVTGRRADLAIIDDPIRSREDADSQTIRDKQWDWWRFDLETRLKPGAGVILIQCMTGDTPVLMADGGERSLRDIRPGDKIATYEGGGITTSTVRNWANQGPDCVFTIKMKSGNIVRANARHPFLAVEGGVEVWRRTDTLKKGSVILKATGANGATLNARWMDAISQPNARGYVTLTTTSIAGKQAFARLQSTLVLGVRRICATVTESILRIMSGFLSSKEGCARFAGSLLLPPIPAHIGPKNSASITATTARGLEGFSATTATSRSDTGKQRKSFAQPLTTFEIEHDEVIEVVESGIEDVFDIQVDRTENFIANGLVSHNTRWHDDDLAGRILNEEGERWRIVKLSMEAGTGDPLGRAPGEPLWPEWYNDQMRADAKRDARVWSALYQQEPTPEEGDYFKSEWLVPVNSIPPLSEMRVYGGSDYAVTSDGGDYTVHAVIGLDADENMYLLDIWRRQAASDEWVESWCDLVLKWKPMGWAEELGQIKSGVGPFLDKRSRERRAYCARDQFPTRGDKAVRAQSIRGRMAMRGLRMLANAPWRSDFIGELLRFPAGVHDDQVDAIGLVGQLLDKMIGGSRIKKDQARPRDKYSREREVSGTWKVV